MCSIMVDLIKRRRSLGLNQDQMAERAGVSKSIIVDVEGRKLKPTAYPSTLAKLAEAYGVGIVDIESAYAPTPAVAQ
jgi:predicted transcriptional regulator